MKSYGVKFRNRGGEIKLRRPDDENAISIINLLVDDYTVTEVLSVRPFADVQFDEMFAVANS
jgi:hypothetical protein